MILVRATSRGQTPSITAPSSAYCVKYNRSSFIVADDKVFSPLTISASPMRPSMSHVEHPVNSLLKASTHAGYSFQYKQADARKPTILFLHGFPGIGDDWRHETAHFVRKRYGVIVLDLLGFGGSKKPAAIEKYHWRAIMDSIEAAVRSSGEYNFITCASRD